jgi:hypothetical protein
MHTGIRRAVGLGLLAVASTFAIAAPAWSDDRGRDGHRRNEGRRDHDGRDHDGRYHGHANQHRRERRGGDDDRRESWRGHRDRGHRAADREWARRRDLDRHRAAATWRFEHGRGWRHFHAGVWSPIHVWWRIDGRPLLRPAPLVRVVSHPTGRYELRGDGITVPFYWVWRPTVVVVAPPPVPAPPPAAFPPPPGYPYPPFPGS